MSDVTIDVEDDARAGGKARRVGGWAAGRSAHRPGPRAGRVPDRGGRPVGQLTKMVLESALEGEITDHLGYDKYERAGDVSNVRNGSRTKTVLTDIGPVPIEVPETVTGRSSRRSSASTSGA